MELGTRVVDPRKELEGIWVEYGDGGELLIARINNPSYNKLFAKLSRPYSRRAQQGNLPEKKSIEILAA